MLGLARVASRAVAPAGGRRWAAPATRALVAARPLSTFKYLETHEYVKVDGDVAVVGISDYAQTQLGDVVYVDLPEVDTEFEKGDTFGSVESVKAASDVYSPVTGTVVEVNEELQDTPELVNSHAMTKAWFVKLKMSDASELGDLLDEDAYKKVIEDQDE